MSTDRRPPRGRWLLPALALSAGPAAATSTATTASAALDLAEIERALGADASPPAAPPAPTGGRPGALAALLPDLAVILDVALAAFSDEAPLQTGGHDPTKNGFNLQQLELSIGGAVDPYFRYDSNLVFAQFGVELEEAYVTTLALPGHLQVRFGQLLTRFGRLNATHPHSWAFVDQPFALGRVFGGEGNRGLGAELSWLAPLPWYAELLVSSTEAQGEATARSFFGATDLGVKSPLDLELLLALKQFFPLGDDLSLFAGVSAATGPNPSGRSNRTDVYGLDVYLKLRPITQVSEWQLALQGELFYRRRQVPGDLLQDLSLYAQVVLSYTRSYAAALRYELGTPEAGRAEVDPALLLDADWVEPRQRLSANLTYWPTEFSRLRLQGSADLPAWRDSPVWALMLAAEVLVGAHGAHAF